MSSSRSTKTLGFGRSEVAKRGRQKQEEQYLHCLKAAAVSVQFVAEHNLPFHIRDHFTKLVKTCLPTQILQDTFGALVQRHLS